MLITDISLTEIYNQKVDIYTLLPVLGYPLFTKHGEQEIVHAVFQISMRERNQYRLSEKVSFLDSSSVNTDTFQHSVKMFTDLILQAYLIIKKRFGEHDTKLFKRHILEKKKVAPPKPKPTMD